MAQALNRVTNEESNVTHSDNKDYFDVTSIYKDSYNLEHWPDDTECMVPCREKTKFWQSTLESDKSELNMTQMMSMQFFLRSHMIKTQMNSGILPQSDDCKGTD